jgi:hypothetical protein
MAAGVICISGTEQIDSQVNSSQDILRIHTIRAGGKNEEVSS